MKLIKRIKTAYNTLYIYKINNKLFVFKPSKKIETEILANKLAGLFNIKTLDIKPFKIKDKEGILMNYLKNSKLLMHYKRKLNNRQINQLKRIILFDIWIGNKDRHTANIFVNHNLTIFDHEKVFQKSRARNFIKIDTGRKLNKNYVKIIEKTLNKDMSVKEVLKKLGFKEKDFLKIKETDIRKTIKNNKIVDFLTSRTDFDSIKF